MLKRGEPFGKVGFGVPYFRPCYEFFQWWSWLLLGGFERGDELLNVPGVPGEVMIPVAHNALAAQFLKTDCDTLVIIEDDHAGDQDVMRRMRQKEENWQFDVVCANYVDRHGVAQAIGVDFGEADETGEILCRVDPLATAKTGTQRMDCAALGLVLIRRWLIEAMVEPEGPGRTFWFEINRGNSQDVQFYRKVGELGGVVGVDRDNCIDHIGKHRWTMAQFYKWQDKARLEPGDPKAEEVA